ncbi:MAG: ferric reductase-like transmembrane domain-containing protein [Chloroflexi bacterium]|nr:ferric reductase-like transmembrane domain-containing protein [Chloroflexota bacterium]
MSNRLTNLQEFDSTEAVVPLSSALAALFAVAVGTVGAILAMESWLPALTQSLVGPTPQAYWDLARVGGIVSYVLLWLSIVFGLVVTNKLARVWPGGPTAVDLHQFTALLGFAFALFHSLVLLGDQYVKYSLLQIVVPFASANYQPFWVGLGQLGFYLLVPVAFSFYFRKRIGYGLWRSIHYGSFVVYALVTVHALLAGSDTTNPGMLLFYAMTTAVVFLFTIYRVMAMSPSLAPGG